MVDGARAAEDQIRGGIGGPYILQVIDRHVTAADEVCGGSLHSLDVGAPCLVQDLRAGIQQRRCRRDDGVVDRARALRCPDDKERRPGGIQPEGLPSGDGSPPDIRAHRRAGEDDAPRPGAHKARAALGVGNGDPTRPP